MLIMHGRYEVSRQVQEQKTVFWKLIVQPIGLDSFTVHVLLLQAEQLVRNAKHIQSLIIQQNLLLFQSLC